MITVQSERWTDEPVPGVKELVLQMVKNLVKKYLVKR
jgi:hypothetical protein